MLGPHTTKTTTSKTNQWSLISMSGWVLTMIHSEASLKKKLKNNSKLVIIFKSSKNLSQIGKFRELGTDQVWFIKISPQEWKISAFWEQLAMEFSLIKPRAWWSSHRPNQLLWTQYRLNLEENQNMRACLAQTSILSKPVDPNLRMKYVKWKCARSN